METNSLLHKSNEQPVGSNIKEILNHNNYLKKEKGDSAFKLKMGIKFSSKQGNEKANEPTKPELYQKVTKEDLEKLCKQLSTFNSRIQTAKQIIHLRYDLPNEMRDKLETEAGELECLYRELQSAANNIETIRNQRAALGKEKLCLENQLTRLKADAVNELEVIVSVYDTDMMERWTAVKSGGSVATAENFLHDVKGKLQAMKNLQILASQKLLQLQKEDNKKEDNTKKKERKKRVREEEDCGNCADLPADNIIKTLSQSSLAFLLDTDSEDVLDDPLYTLVCDEVLNLPAWTQGSLDID